MDGLTCCRRCRGALQICRWDLCDCHRRSAEKNLSHDTRTYRNPTADKALSNIANPKRRNRPMSPAPSKHAQIRDAAETYYKEFGEYVETPGQEVAVANLAASINRWLTVPAFEEILTTIRRRDITQTGNVGIWDGDREIWPNESDYTQARDQQAQHQDADVTALIIALTGETP